MTELGIELLGPYKLAAVTKNNEIEELLVSRQNEGCAGYVFVGKVLRVVSSLRAAFLDIGLTKNAYLQVEDVPKCRSKAGLIDIETVLYPGMLLPVQVIRESFGDKGPRVSANISIPGKLVVYRPFGGGINFSKNIYDEAWKCKVTSELESVLKTGGVIVRTDAIEASLTDIRSEMVSLQNMWHLARQKHNGVKSGLLYAHDEFMSRISEYIKKYSPERVYVDSSSSYTKIRNFILTEFSEPRLFPQIICSSCLERMPLLIQELERHLLRKVPLKSGAELVIDETEALTVIDVDSSGNIGNSNARESVLKINLEAVRTITRELKLRNIGGAVVVDFINLVNKEGRSKVITAINSALKNDLVQTMCFGFTHLGLVELSRHRQFPSLKSTLFQRCANCDGLEPSPEFLVLRLRAEVIKCTLKNKHGYIKVCCSHELAELYRSYYPMTYVETVSDDASNIIEYECVLNWQELPEGTKEPFAVFVDKGVGKTR